MFKQDELGQDCFVNITVSMVIFQKIPRAFGCPTFCFFHPFPTERKTTVVTAGPCYSGWHHERLDYDYEIKTGDHP